MKTTHLTLSDRERALAAMRASQLGVTLTDYVAALVRRDADESGLSSYFDRQKEVSDAQ